MTEDTVDPILHRLENLIRSMFQPDPDDYDTIDHDYVDSNRFTDSDLKDAWDELNDFLGAGTSSRPNHNQKGQQPNAERKRYTRVPLQLTKDYETLQVPFGASFSEVKKSYKKLIIACHPDRHADNTEKATEMTQKINYAFQRIKKYEETGKI